MSLNREDKIQFIKDGLSKESLDDILLTLEMHSCGLVVDVLNKLASARIYWSIDLVKYEVDPTRIAMKRENAKKNPNNSNLVHKIWLVCDQEIKLCNA